MNLLHIDSGILGDASVSRTLSADIVARLAAQTPDVTITHRDLALTPLPHLTGEVFAGGGDPSDLAAGRAALAEFLAADVIVVGAPMYNFGIPSQLKAWIDRIAANGQTFRYTADGPVGLAGGKRVIVASSRGGIYSAGPTAGLDHQETYLAAVFGFLGITDVEFVRAEGVAISPDHRVQAIATARGHIEGLAPGLRRAA